MKQNQNNPIEKFAEQLLKEKNLSVEDPDVLTELKNDLVDRVEGHINATVLENMPPEKIEEFEKIVESGNEVEIQEFCQRHISNLDEVVAKALLRFRSVYLGLSQ